MKRDGISAPVFLKKDLSFAFQAADMLAYEHLSANKHLLNGKVAQFEDLRYPLRALIKIPDGGAQASDWGVFGESDLEQFCITVNLPARNSDLETVWPQDVI